MTATAIEGVVALSAFQGVSPQTAFNLIITFSTYAKCFYCIT